MEELSDEELESYEPYVFKSPREIQTMINQLTANKYSDESEVNEFSENLDSLRNSIARYNEEYTKGQINIEDPNFVEMFLTEITRLESGILKDIPDNNIRKSLLARLTAIKSSMSDFTSGRQFASDSDNAQATIITWKSSDDELRVDDSGKKLCLEMQKDVKMLTELIGYDRPPCYNLSGEIFDNLLATLTRINKIIDSFSSTDAEYVNKLIQEIFINMGMVKNDPNNDLILFGDKINSVYNYQLSLLPLLQYLPKINKELKNLLSFHAYSQLSSCDTENVIKEQNELIKKIDQKIHQLQQKQIQ